MKNLKVAIIITLVVTLALSMMLNVMGALLAGKQFIYNLSQMEYEGAYRVLQGVVKEYLAGYWPQYSGLFDKDTIKHKLDLYIARASELTAIENYICGLRRQAKSYTGNLILKLSSVTLIIILIWHELRDTKRQEELCQKY